MIRDELDKIEALESETRDAAAAARIEANEARKQFGLEMLADAGIVIGETICEYFKYPWDKQLTRGIVVTVSGEGMAVTREVTKSGEIHLGRNSKQIKIEDLKIGEMN